MPHSPSGAPSLLLLSWKISLCHGEALFWSQSQVESPIERMRWSDISDAVGCVKGSIKNNKIARNTSHWSWCNHLDSAVLPFLAAKRKKSQHLVFTLQFVVELWARLKRLNALKQQRDRKQLQTRTLVAVTDNKPEFNDLLSTRGGP